MSKITVEIKNYQSIEHCRLVFDLGVNVICGPSNSGKTAVLRAIYSAIMNPRASRHHIKDGEKEASVMIHIEGHPEITWRRLPETVIYELEGVKEPFKKAANSNIWTIYPEFPLLKEESGAILNFHREHDTLFPFGMSPQDLFKQFEKVTSIDDSATILTAMKRHQADLALERGLLTTQLSKTQKLTKTGKTLITEATATTNLNVVVRTTAVADTVATANVADTDDVNTITESISSFQIPVREDDLSISDPLFQDQIYDLKDHLYIEGLEIPDGGILTEVVSPVEEERSVGFMVDRIPLMGNTDPGPDRRIPGDFPGTPEVSVPICDAAIITSESLTVEEIVRDLGEYLRVAPEMSKDLDRLEFSVPQLERGKNLSEALQESLKEFEEGLGVVRVDLVASQAIEQDLYKLQILEVAHSRVRTLPEALPNVVDLPEAPQAIRVGEDLSLLLNLLSTYSTTHEAIESTKKQFEEVEKEIAKFEGCPLCGKPWDENHVD